MKKKRILLLIGVVILLVLTTYFVDYAMDGNDVDCFDTIINHLVISFGVLAAVIIIAICFLLFHTTENDKNENEGIK